MSDDVSKIQINDVSASTDDLSIDADSLEATKKLVQNLSVKLDELKEKQKEYRERLKNLLDNDALLSEYEEAAKSAAEAYKKRKKDLMNSVEAKEIRAKMKELKEEMGDIAEALTNHLINYFSVTKTQSFETPDGQEREFKFNAKLLPVKDQ